MAEQIGLTTEERESNKVRYAALRAYKALTMLNSVVANARHDGVDLGKLSALDIKALLTEVKKLGNIDWASAPDQDGRFKTVWMDSKL